MYWNVFTVVTNPLWQQMKRDIKFSYTCMYIEIANGAVYIHTNPCNRSNQGQSILQCSMFIQGEVNSDVNTYVHESNGNS